MTSKTQKSAAKAPADCDSSPSEPLASPAKSQTKTDLLIQMLRRPGGATSEETQTATGWQAHSVRGALAGTLKTRRGLTVLSQKINDVRIYRIASDEAA